MVKSLVPGGVAHQDGRLMPGDRLLFVNASNLENATLEQAVQVLKLAPQGAVHLGIAKPLPLPKLSSPTSPLAGGVPLGVELEQAPHTKKSRHEGLSSAPIPCAPIPCENIPFSSMNQFKLQDRCTHEQASPTSSTCSYTSSQVIPTLTQANPTRGEATHYGDNGVRSLIRFRGVEIPALPRELEQKITIRKGSEKLGEFSLLFFLVFCSCVYRQRYISLKFLYVLFKEKISPDH